MKGAFQKVKKEDATGTRVLQKQEDSWSERPRCKRKGKPCRWSPNLNYPLFFSVPQSQSHWSFCFGVLGSHTFIGL